MKDLSNKVAIITGSSEWRWSGNSAPLRQPCAVMLSLITTLTPRGATQVAKECEELGVETVCFGGEWSLTTPIAWRW